MPQPIADAAYTLKMIKEAGYKSAATAIGELIDNSLQAEAENIDILVINKKQRVGARSSNNVFKLAVLDDGHGMDLDTLSKCLSLGWGSRLDATEGLGKFGFGLKGSSISQAEIVKVYSWQSPGEVYMSEIDSPKIYKDEIQHIEDPVKTNLPKEFIENFHEALGNTGTLVIWEDLDLDVKMSDTLSRRLNEELCRIYRHFLDEDDDYGERRNITIKNLQVETGEITAESLRANDPLYLLTPNNLPDEELQDKQTNALIDKVELNIDYEDLNGEIKTSNVLVTFSMAKPEIQNLRGNSKVGNHYEENCGVSFVRAGREIEFGRFNLLDNSEPRHRWWGAEVRFEPELDKIFKITNNKQNVRGFKGVSKEKIKSLELEAEYGNLNSKMILKLNRCLSEGISGMMSVITSRKSGSLSEKKKKNPVLERGNEVFDNNNSHTESEQCSQTPEQKIESLIEVVMNNDTSLTKTEAREIAETQLDFKVNLITTSWPGSLFLERSIIDNQSIGEINMRTKFYKQFWRYLETANDQKGFEALQLILMALVRAEDELSYGNSDRKETFLQYREKWGQHIEELLKNAIN
jgi:hypothetical protein